MKRDHIKLIAMLLGRIFSHFPSRSLSEFLTLPLFGLLSGDLTPVLTYHAVNPVRAISGNPLVEDHIHNVSPEMLHFQLSTIKKRFRFVEIDELGERILKGRSIKGLSSVTFDDGYLSVLRFAMPILDDLEIPATLFISTGLIRSGTFWRDKVRYVINKRLVEEFLEFSAKQFGAFAGTTVGSFYMASKDPAVVNSRLVNKMLNTFFESMGEDDVAKYEKGLYCTKEDLEMIDSSSFSIGNHTHSHYVLSSLSREEQFDEIVTVKKLIESLGLRHSLVFSIPFGAERDINDDTKEILKELGYIGYALSMGSRISDALTGENLIDKKSGLVILRRYMPENKKSFLFS